MQLCLKSELSKLLPILLLGFVTIASAEDNFSTEELLGMSMEELMNVKVVSVSRREESYYDSAAAVFVISNDDIRRSGARNIPEALRLAPGVEVARVNANQYAVAIRGQNDLFSDKLLVLRNGRTLYTPSTSGVFWLAQNYPLEDIERIEVIRGPSGVVWGANAVNGVINIITKNAQQTQGAFVSLGGGIEEDAFASLRFGTETDKMALRGYLMSEKRDGGIFPSESERPSVFRFGENAPDDRRFSQGGFRLDWLLDEQTDVSLQGDLYDVRAGAFGTHVPRPFIDSEQAYESTSTYKGHGLVLKTDTRFTDQSNLSTQLFYDQYRFDTISYGETRDTFDLNLQYNTKRILGNLISVGGNYRHSSSDITETQTLQMPDDSMNIISMFINNDIELIENRLRLIAGIKLEKSSYMSWQSQPHLRAIYTDDGWGLWAAASRAVRSPNKVEQSVNVNIKSGGPASNPPAAPPFVVKGVGTGAVEPEIIESYELGVRLHPNSKLLLQLTAFHINYSGISDFNGTKTPVPLPSGSVEIPFFYVNVLDGKSEGVEADISFKINDWAKIKGTYSFLHQSYRPVEALAGDPEALDTVQSTLKQSPKNRYSVGLSLDPSDSLELDLNLYGWSLYRNDGFGPDDRVVNSYNRLDARIGWQVTDNTSFTLAGQNLLKATHREDVDSALEFSSLIQQSYYFKIDYTY